jgi:4,5-dihydroxyphthalate decarboxylase
MMYGNGHLRLSTMMGTYPKTKPLKSGTVAPPSCELAFDDVDVAQKAFKAAVRDLKYDVTEIAIVTFLQAFAAGKPYVLLPFVMNGNFHHGSILKRAGDKLDPGALVGRRAAMRAYSQTTPTWVRGILSDDYGVKVESVRWLSQEGAHVADYREPSWVQTVDSASSLEEMLLSGDVDAIIASGLGGNPKLEPLIPEPRKAALAWYTRQHVVPINHMVAVRRELAEARPDIVKDIYAALKESRRAGDNSPAGDGPNLQPFGFQAVRPAVEMIVRYAAEQRLIPESYPVESLFGKVLEAVGT